MKNILLCSGGLDSMVIYHTMKEEIDECIYIKYRGDHPATLRELEVIKNEGIDIKVIDIDDLQCDEVGFYNGRNLKFILTVRELYVNEDITVFVGNTSNDNFNDNTRLFFYKLEDVINNSYTKKIRIVCPLENCTKKSIVSLAKKANINFYFCDKGDKKPCMKCHSCKAMADCGYFD